MSHREGRNVEPGMREERGLEGEGGREKLFILD